MPTEEQKTSTPKLIEQLTKNYQYNGKKKSLVNYATKILTFHSILKL